MSHLPWLKISIAGIVIVLIGVSYISTPLVTTAVLSASLRQSTPIILGAPAGILCERSGVVNIGIEGMMLTAAFTGFLGNVWTGNLFLATLLAILGGGCLGAMHAWMSVSLKVDQIISGTVINIMALGVTGYFYQQGLTTQGKFQPIDIPILADIPLLGNVFFTNPPITYSALVLVVVVHGVLFWTRWGLRTPACVTDVG